jgi:hypothetical protein
MFIPQENDTEWRVEYLEVAERGHDANGRPWTDFFCPYCDCKARTPIGHYADRASNAQLIIGRAMLALMAIDNGQQFANQIARAALDDIDKMRGEQD